MGTGRGGQFAVLLILSFFVAFSAAQLIDAYSSEPWFRLAARLEDPNNPALMTPAYKARIEREVQARKEGTCEFDLSKSRVAVALDALRRRIVEQASVADIQAMTRSARKILGEAIDCSPGDGNLWYLLALIEERLGAEPDRVQSLIAMSASRSPREGDLLLKRSRLTLALLAKPGLELDDRLKTGLKIALGTISPDSARAIVKDLGQEGHAALAEELLAALPDARRTLLVDGPTSKRSTFGRPERYRAFEFDPYGRLPPKM